MTSAEVFTQHAKYQLWPHFASNDDAAAAADDDDDDDDYFILNNVSTQKVYLWKYGMLTLKVLSKNVADDILFFNFFFQSK